MTAVTWEQRAADLEPSTIIHWQSIDTAPKDGSRFLAYEKTSNYSISECWWESDFGGQWQGWTNDWDNEPNPTHWAPMPNLPSTDYTKEGET